MTFEFPMRADASLLVGVALLIAGCSRPSSSALKPIDQAALQTMVDTTAKELLVPGAVVLLRTPQGEFTVTHGTTTSSTVVVNWLILTCCGACAPCAHRAKPKTAATIEFKRLPNSTIGSFEC